MFGSFNLLQDVAARGSAALADYRNQQQPTGRYNPASGALDNRQQVLNAFEGQPVRQQQPANSNDFNQLYDQWATQYLAPGQTNPTVYGQSKKGIYAGFHTSSDLWNAIEGKASMTRKGAQIQAGQVRDTAAAKVDALKAEYDKALHDAIMNMNKEDAQRASSSNFSGAHATGHFAAPTPAAATPATQAVLPSGVQQINAGTEAPDYQAGANFGALTSTTGSAGHPKLAEPVRRYQSGPNTGSVEATPEQEKYKTDLKNWLAAKAGPATEAANTASQFADMVDQTPLSAFENSAGAQYGVDPNIVAGRFGDKEDVTDYGTQRNISAIQQYGLPYSEVLGLQGDATDAASTADKQGTKDQEAALETELQQQTGVDPTQLASAANITVPQLGEVVASSGYQQASQLLQGIIDNAQDDPSGAQNAFEDNLRKIGAQDPVLYSVLLAQFQPYGASKSDYFDSSVTDGG